MGTLLFSCQQLSLSEFDAANDSNRSTSSRVFVPLEIDQVGEPLSRLKWAMWCRGGWFRQDRLLIEWGSPLDFWFILALQLELH